MRTTHPSLGVLVLPMAHRDPVGVRPCDGYAKDNLPTTVSKDLCGFVRVQTHTVAHRGPLHVIGDPVETAGSEDRGIGACSAIGDDLQVHVSASMYI